MYRQALAVDGLGISRQLAVGDLAVHLAPDGRLRFVASRPLPAATAATVRDMDRVEQPLSAEEAALVAQCRAKIDELRSRRYVGAPDPADVIRGALRQIAPGVGCAAVAWALNALGVAPWVSESVLSAAATARALTRRIGSRPREAHAPAQAASADFVVFRPKAVLSLLLCVLESIEQASRIDDTALEDELDGVYPFWSRVDFEWDPRCYTRRSRPNRVRNPRYRRQTAGPATPDTRPHTTLETSFTRPASRGEVRPRTWPHTSRCPTRTYRSASGRREATAELRPRPRDPCVNRHAARYLPLTARLARGP